MTAFKEIIYKIVIRNFKKMKFFSKDWWHNLKHKFQERKRKNRLSALKRRTEYLFLNPRLFWHKLKVRLHPQSLWSYFTSKRGLWALFKLFFSFTILIFTVITLGYVYYRYSLDINLVAETDCLEYRTFEFYDSSGEQLLWQHSEGGVCYPITLEEVSPYFIDALIVVEDKDFYSHPGFKFTSIGRAVFNNIRGRPLQGGSTITQQYVKNAILRDGKRNFDRKIKEAILVPEIEDLYTKDQILTAYLNTVFLGNNYSGVEAAAQGYFDKKSRHLSLDEAALLVATIQAPNVVWEDPQLHIKRRNIVLSQMLKNKKITQKQYDNALKMDTLAKIIPANIRTQFSRQTIANHYLLTAKKEFSKSLCFGEENCQPLHSGNYKVITSLDIEMQKQAQTILAEAQTKIPESTYDNYALIVLDTQTHQVLALMGSLDFQEPVFGQVNQIEQVIYPQDFWKPFIYSSFLENELEVQYGNPLSGLRNDDQSKHLRTLKRLGINDLNSSAKKLDLKVTPSTNNCSPQCWQKRANGRSFQLPFSSLITAYNTLANEGQHQKPVYILRIDNSQGKTIFENRDQAARALTEETTRQINQALKASKLQTSSLRHFKNLTSIQTDIGKYPNNYSIGYNSEIVFGLYFGRDTPSIKEIETEMAVQKKIIAEFQLNVIELLLEKFQKRND